MILDLKKTKIKMFCQFTFKHCLAIKKTHFLFKMRIVYPYLSVIIARTGVLLLPALDVDVSHAPYLESNCSNIM